MQIELNLDGIKVGGKHSLLYENAATFHATSTYPLKMAHKE